MTQIFSPVAEFLRIKPCEVALSLFVLMSLNGLHPTWPSLVDIARSGKGQIDPFKGVFLIHFGREKEKNRTKNGQNPSKLTGPYLVLFR